MSTAVTGTDPSDPFTLQAGQHRAHARDLAPRLGPEQFFSHATAAMIWGAPIPLATDASGAVLDGGELPLHVSTLGSGPLVRSRGVAAHRADPRTSQFIQRGGVRAASPATVWTSMGALPIAHLVALGDYFCRQWRAGVGRKDAGSVPFATIADLRAAIASGRRVGNRRLRQAIDLVREDSWSPRESRVRCELVLAGLPEPELNVDVFDSFGRFLGCVDMAYPEQRVIVEYHGTIHSERYAKDVERIAALRAAGWTVIEVTAELLRRPAELVARVASALRAG